eukprot:scaffold16363_cov114-Isochrysis_galbana.AAC.3
MGCRRRAWRRDRGAGTRKHAGHSRRRHRTRLHGALTSIFLVSALTRSRCDAASFCAATTSRALSSSCPSIDSRLACIILRRSSAMAAPALPARRALICPFWGSDAAIPALRTPRSSRRHAIPASSSI